MTLLLALAFALLSPGADLVADDPLCAPLYRLARTDYCTHGEDTPPTEAAGGTIPPVYMPGRIVCDGDGLSGKRVQLVYVHEGVSLGRLAMAVEEIRGIAAQMDGIVDASAHLTGGHRHIRFVTDADCQPTVLSFATHSWSFGLIVRALIEAGYEDGDRKYVIFDESHRQCGVATVRREDFDDKPNYAYIGRHCWHLSTIATHELIHALGAVQLDSPNASGGFHCTDEHDLMCHSDPPHYPPMRIVCPPPHKNLLDCNHDDYFHTNPEPGSYLATHWNVANSAFLIRLVEWRFFLPGVLAGAEGMELGSGGYW